MRRWLRLRLRLRPISIRSLLILILIFIGFLNFRMSVTMTMMMDDHDHHHQEEEETFIRGYDNYDSTKTKTELEPPNRDLYRHFSIIDIDHHFECDNTIERPIMPESAWTDARQLYASHLSRRNKEGSSTPPLLPDPKENGFSVPMEVRKSPGKGRGIFAMRDIRKGELIWSAKQTARFADGNDFRDFVFSLDKTYVCDFLNFAYLQSLTKTSAMESKNDSAAANSTAADVPESTQVFISIDLDEGGLCNDRSVGHEDESNVGCDNIMADGHEGGCERNMFALRDIKADEEFICNYSEFLAKKRWKYFGL